MESEAVILPTHKMGTRDASPSHICCSIAKVSVFWEQADHTHRIMLTKYFGWENNPSLDLPSLSMAREKPYEYEMNIPLSIYVENVFIGKI
jgi:hypothetical protein